MAYGELLKRLLMLPFLNKIIFYSLFIQAWKGIQFSNIGFISIRQFALRKHLNKSIFDMHWAKVKNVDLWSICYFSCYQLHAQHPSFYNVPQSCIFFCIIKVIQTWVGASTFSNWIENTADNCDCQKLSLIYS